MVSRFPLGCFLQTWSHPTRGGTSISSAVKLDRWLTAWWRQVFLSECGSSAGIAMRRSFAVSTFSASQNFSDSVVPQASLDDGQKSRRGRLLLIEKRYVLRWRGLWPRLQIRVDVGEFLVRDDFRSEGWHLAGGLADVRDEGANETLWRTDARARRLSRALSFTPVAFIAAVFRENLFASLRIPHGSRFGFFALRRGVLRSRRRSREQKDRANRRQSDAPDRIRIATLDRVHGWKKHIHTFPFAAIVPQDRSR
jgi:hypothetical protein